MASSRSWAYWPETRLLHSSVMLAVISGSLERIERSRKRFELGLRDTPTRSWVLAGVEYPSIASPQVWRMLISMTSPRLVWIGGTEVPAGSKAPRARLATAWLP
jgi:hypothetical protein